MLQYLYFIRYEIDTKKNILLHSQQISIVCIVYTNIDSSYNKYL